MTAWLRITGNSNIYSISRLEQASVEDQEDFLNFGEDGRKLNVRVSDGTTTLLNATTTQDAFEWSKWTHVALTFDWKTANGKTVVKIYSNNNEVLSNEFLGAFVDKASFKHVIGAEYNFDSANSEHFLDGFYHGNIW
jgi:hypothetical protein